MTISFHDHDNSGHDGNNDHANNDIDPHADDERASSAAEEDVYDDFSFEALTGHCNPEGPHEDAAAPAPEASLAHSVHLTENAERARKVAYRLELCLVIEAMIESGNGTPFFGKHASENVADAHHNAARALVGPRRGKHVSAYRYQLPSVRTVQRWYREFVASDGNPASLVPRYRRRERVSPFVGLEDTMRALTANQHPRQTFRSRYEKLCMLVSERIDGLPEEERIHVPSLKAFRAETRCSEPVFAGCGIDAARGTAYSRYEALNEPHHLDNVVTETHCIGAVAIAAMLQVSPIALPDALKKLWITLSYDAATWCIVQADVKATPPDRDGVADVVHAIMMDKTDRASKLGCLSGWEMCGVPRSVHMEADFPFAGSAKEATIKQIGVNFYYPLTKYWSGRRFVEKVVMAASVIGEHAMSGGEGQQIDAAEAQWLTEAALTRYIVDCYHNMPNAALGGETPRAKWECLRATQVVSRPRM